MTQINQPKKQPTVVVDTSVIVDIFVRGRPRHELALKLAKKFRELNFKPLLPCHAFLEIVCAIRNERQFQPGEISLESFTKDLPLELNVVPIDMTFVNTYLDHNLPYMKAGDLIFIAIAKRDKLALLTEDKKQYEKAKEGNVKAFTIAELLDELERNPPI